MRGNVDVVDLWAWGRREVRAMAGPVGVLIHDEADKVLDALLAIVHNGKEERGQSLPKSGEVRVRRLSLDRRVRLERRHEERLYLVRLHGGRG